MNNSGENTRNSGKEKSENGYSDKSENYDKPAENPIRHFIPPTEEELDDILEKIIPSEDVIAGIDEVSSESTEQSVSTEEKKEITQDSVLDNLERWKKFEEVSDPKNISCYEDLMPSCGNKNFNECNLEEKLFVLEAVEDKSIEKMADIISYEPSFGLNIVKGRLVQDIFRYLVKSYNEGGKNKSIELALAQNLQKALGYIIKIKNSEKNIFGYHGLFFKEADKKIKQNIIRKLFVISGASLTNTHNFISELFGLLKESGKNKGISETPLDLKASIDIYNSWLKDIFNVIKDHYLPTPKTYEDFTYDTSSFLKKQRILRIYRFLHLNENFMSNINGFACFWQYNSKEDSLKQKFEDLARRTEQELSRFSTFKKSYENLDGYVKYSKEFKILTQQHEKEKEKLISKQLNAARGKGENQQNQ